jgi:hypothetical protein
MSGEHSVPERKLKMPGQPTSRPTLCSERKNQNRALRKEPVPSEAEGMGHPSTAPSPRVKSGILRAVEDQGDPVQQGDIQ